MLTDQTHPGQPARNRTNEVWLDVDAQRAARAYARGAADIRAQVDAAEAAALAHFMTHPRQSPYGSEHPTEPAAASAARWRRNAEWEAAECDRMALTLAAGTGAARMPESEVRAWFRCESGRAAERWLRVNPKS